MPNRQLTCSSEKKDSQESIDARKGMGKKREPGEADGRGPGEGPLLFLSAWRIKRVKNP